jgi:hypothetical protein
MVLILSKSCFPGIITVSPIQADPLIDNVARINPFFEVNQTNTADSRKEAYRIARPWKGSSQGHV